ncbi:MAG: hypothetical protein RR249_06890 [Tannerellaceae bacterium]
MKSCLWMVLLAALAACGGKKAEMADTSWYFNGDFVYFADAASLKDCATGTVLPIAMKGDYKALEKAYLAMNPDEKESINCELKGYLIDKPANEEGLEKQLVVTSLIGFDRTVGCSETFLTQNVYAAYITPDAKPEQKTSLTLDANYTFQSSTYQLSPIELTDQANGTWHRTADEKIILLVGDSILYEGSINTAQHSLLLTKRSDGKETLFQGE